MISVEAAILNRVVAPEKGNLDKKAAETFLLFRFPDLDRARMEQLAEAARAGVLTDLERSEIDGYERIGHLISLLKSKARASLRAA